MKRFMHCAHCHRLSHCRSLRRVESWQRSCRQLVMLQLSDSALARCSQWYLAGETCFPIKPRLWARICVWRSPKCSNSKLQIAKPCIWDILWISTVQLHLNLKVSSQKALLYLLTVSIVFPHMIPLSCRYVSPIKTWKLCPTSRMMETNCPPQKTAISSPSLVIFGPKPI